MPQNPTMGRARGEPLATIMEAAAATQPAKVARSTWVASRNGSKNTIEFCLDGQLQARVVEKGHGCVDGTNSVWAAPPAFTQLRLGFVNYQSKAETTTLWIDDFAAGSARLGCPAPAHTKVQRGAPWVKPSCPAASIHGIERWRSYNRLQLLRTMLGFPLAKCVQFCANLRHHKAQYCHVV